MLEEGTVRDLIPREETVSKFLPHGEVDSDDPYEEQSLAECKLSSSASHYGTEISGMESSPQECQAWVGGDLQVHLVGEEHSGRDAEQSHHGGGRL